MEILGYEEHSAIIISEYSHAVALSEIVSHSKNP